MENIYTKDNWNKDGYLKVKVGQYVADDVIKELRDSMPPASYKASCFQPGEAYTLSMDYIDLYMTFVIDNGMWRYVGLCPKGSNVPQPEINYNEPIQINENILKNIVVEAVKRIINERTGLNSQKLFQLSKEHGGFAEKTPSFYLNDITDNDVVGVVSDDEWRKLYHAPQIESIKWAQNKGFEINKGDEVVLVPLKDRTWVALIERGSLLADKEYINSPIGKKLNSRYNNKLGDGAREYQWSDTQKWGSPRAEEFYMRRTQNNIANQRRQRYGNDAVYKLSESFEGLDKFATKTDVTRFTNNLINKLYKVAQPYTSHRFRDNDWRHLKTFVNILSNIDGVEELIPSGTGPYKQSQEGAYKEYKIDITTVLGSKIEGFIRCHFCGTQEDPWEAYDMTVGFWKGEE